MTDNEKYFISLLSSFLNSDEVPNPDNIDWEEIYRLSEIHNVSAITANQISSLPESKKPDKKILSAFRQQIGYQLIDFDNKEKVYKLLEKILSENDIDYIFVKGIILHNLYPVKEFRSSSDIDVIVRCESMVKCREVLSAAGMKLLGNDNYFIDARTDDVHIEIHADKNEDSNNEYFKNIFELAERDEINPNRYNLSNETHMLYILCHIIKHFNICGAGVRMFMDIDVLIRRINLDDRFDYNRFFNLCKDLNIEIFAKAAFSLCNEWFSTPIKTDFDINNDKKIKETFENEILAGGVFGFEKRSLSDYYISMGIGSSNKNNSASKLRAFWALLFPSKEYLKGYSYARKHPILLPVAWFERLFKAIFVRFSHSKQTISGIVHSGEESAQYKELLNELEI